MFLQIDSRLIVCFNGLLIISFLCTFKCLCIPFLRPYNNHKLDFHSSPCVFFGYNSSHLGYRCFDIASQCIYISCHVCFHEHVFLFDNSKQIVKVSATTPTQPATTLLPNLIHSPSFTTHTAPHHPSSTSALPPPTTKTPQPPPFPCPSSYPCLSNHSAAGTCCKSVSPTLQHDASAGVGTPSGSSSASSYLASVQAVTGSTSADIPVVAASPLLAVDSLTAFSASLNLVVDFSSYLLQQDTSLPPSSPASPPLISHHPMVLKSRQPKTANLVASTVADTASTSFLSTSCLL